jgi:hypothetical protein
MNAPERAVPHIPMREFFRNPQETQHRVSPDGAYISSKAESDQMAAALRQRGVEVEYLGA